MTDVGEQMTENIEVGMQNVETIDFELRVWITKDIRNKFFPPSQQINKLTI